MMVAEQVEHLWLYATEILSFAVFLQEALKQAGRMELTVRQEKLEVAVAVAVGKFI